MLVACYTVEWSRFWGSNIRAPSKFYVFSAEKALELVKERRPPVMLLSCKLGVQRMRAIELVPLVHRYSPETKVIFLTEGAAPSERKEAIELGAYGIVDVLKDGFVARLQAIVDVALRQVGASSSPSVVRRRVSSALH